MNPPTPLGSLGKIPREVRDAIYSFVFRASYESIDDSSEHHITDWRTLSILQTSKLIHLEASDVLYAQSRFYIPANWSIKGCYNGVNEKRMRNVTFYMSYYHVSKLKHELPRLDVNAFDLPSRERVFHDFAKVCDTEMVMKKFVVYVFISRNMVQSAENRELGHLEKLGHRLARFSPAREIIVELIYTLFETPWRPGTKPKFSAIPLLKHLKPLFGSYTENTEIKDDKYHLQRFIFRDPVPSQEKRLITGPDSDATLDGEGGPNLAIGIQ